MGAELGDVGADGLSSRERSPRERGRAEERRVVGPCIRGLDRLGLPGACPRIVGEWLHVLVDGKRIAVLADTDDALSGN